MDTKTWVVWYNNTKNAYHIALSTTPLSNGYIQLSEHNSFDEACDYIDSLLKNKQT